MKLRPQTLLIGALFLCILHSYISSPAKAASCPDASLGETAEDCPWAGITRDLQAAATHGRSVISILAEEQTALFNAMKVDAERKDWLNLWGFCINYDELGKGIIVSPDIIYPLMKMFSPPSGAPFAANGRMIVHAGVQHTYGYLFSNLRTSFGYKRARWVRNTLDRGFGLPNGTISPIPNAGSLFSNATYFAGIIAFRDDPQALNVLKRGALHGVSPAITSFNFGLLRPIRLEEIIKTPSGDVALRTDFVPFLNRVEGDSNTFWLIYSVADRRSGAKENAKLITAFPVTNSFVETALNPNGLGENKSIITRYNAFVPGITGTHQVGIRRKF